MLVFLNGKFVPEEQAVVSVFDRSFLYGDGLFEAVLVRRGQPFRWNQHLERLQRGAEFLKIKLPFTSKALESFAGELVSKNGMTEALLRLTLSRGVGVRGYSPKGAGSPTLVMSLHPTNSVGGGFAQSDALRSDRVPPLTSWNLICASPRLPSNEPLAQFKTCNKLAQVLARAEADAAGADEALLLNTDGYVAEGATSNLFWIEGETLCTPPLASGILAGVTRAVIMEICTAQSIRAREAQMKPAELQKADGVFVSLSSLGVVEARSLDGVALRASPLSEKVHQAYWKLVEKETVC